jgi:hypothetical protein
MPPTFQVDGSIYAYGDFVEADLAGHSILSRPIRGRLILERSSSSCWNAFVVATETQTTRGGATISHGGSRPRQRSGTRAPDGGMYYPADDVPPLDHELPRFKIYDSWCIGTATKITDDAWMLTNRDFRTLRLIAPREDVPQSISHIITNKQPITLHRDGRTIKTLTTTR